MIFEGLRWKFYSLMIKGSLQIYIFSTLAERSFNRGFVKSRDEKSKVSKCIFQWTCIFRFDLVNPVNETSAELNALQKRRWYVVFISRNAGWADLSFIDRDHDNIVLNFRHRYKNTQPTTGTKTRRWNFVMESSVVNVYSSVFRLILAQNYFFR